MISLIEDGVSLISKTKMQLIECVHFTQYTIECSSGYFPLKSNQVHIGFKWAAMFV